jgi:phosphohistidine swiveling domain-containing protein
MIRLDPAQLMANARAATGLTDFGDPWFMPAFEKVVELVNAEGGLTSPDADPVL